MDELKSMSNENQNPIHLLVITIFILGLVVVIGTIGNILVLLVYLRRKSHSKHHEDDTDRFFIITLAISDLVVCLLIVPSTAIVEWNTFHISLLFCKLYFLFNTSNTLFSTMLIALIAVDRCLCIRYALHKIMTVTKAKISIAGLMLMATTMGIGSTIVVDIKFHHHNDSSDSNKTGVCEEIKFFDRVNGTSKLFYNIFETLNHLTYYLSIVIVIVCYSLVYVEIISIRRREKDLKLTQPRRSQEKSAIATTTTELSASETYQSPSEDSLMQPRRSLVQGLKDSALFRNIKSAAMLFVVAVVYITVFTPVLLIASMKVISFNIILYNLYYINNAANPVVYCFMNSSFRRDLKTLFISTYAFSEVNLMTRFFFPVAQEIVALTARCRPNNSSYLTVDFTASFSRLDLISYMHKTSQFEEVQIFCEYELIN